MDFQQDYDCLAYYEDHLAEVDYLIARQFAEAGACPFCSTLMCLMRLGV